MPRSQKLAGWTIAKWLEVDITWEEVVKLGYDKFPLVEGWAAFYSADRNPFTGGMT